MANEKIVKSIYLTQSEKKMCKQALLDLNIESLEEFYNRAVIWYLSEHDRFPYLFAKDSKVTACTSVWLNKGVAKKLDAIVKSKKVTASHFIHTSIILFLEKHGYFKNIMSIDWPSKN